jgi:hypothetical protein
MYINPFKNPRSLGRFLLYPQHQLKYAVLMSLFCAVTCGMTWWLDQVFIQHLILRITNAEDLSLVVELHQEWVWIQLIFVLLASILIFLITIVVLHRFLGPIVPISRYLNNIADGKDTELIIRKNDALYPLLAPLRKLSATNGSASRTTEKSPS